MAKPRKIARSKAETYRIKEAGKMLTDRYMEYLVTAIMQDLEKTGNWYDNELEAVMSALWHGMLYLKKNRIRETKTLAKRAFEELDARD